MTPRPPRGPSTSRAIRKNLTNVQFWDKQLGWAVGWKSTILRTTDGGKKWAATNVPSGISLEGISMVSKKTGWAVGCSGPHVPYADMDAGYGAVVLKTTDGGLNWKFVLNRTTKPGLAGVDFTDTKHGVAVGTNGLTARTADGGKTWWLRTVGSETLRDIKFIDALQRRHGRWRHQHASAAAARCGRRPTAEPRGRRSKLATADRPCRSAPGALPVRDRRPRALGLTAVGDRGQSYLSADGVALGVPGHHSAVVTQDPSLHARHGHRPDGARVAGARPSGRRRSGGFSGTTVPSGRSRNCDSGLPWRLPPTISSFTPEVGVAQGTAITVYGSGFKPNVPGDVSAIGLVEVTDAEAQATPSALRRSTIESACRRAARNGHGDHRSLDAVTAHLR